jgi:5-methylcytosine-specific restriction endonuclease McrA
VSQVIPSELRSRVVELDRSRCAYCMTSMRVVGPLLEIDHIVPRAKGGATEEANLSVRLYHPRQDSWAAHFAWTEHGTTVRGTTPSGRATVAALQMNHQDIVAARRLWVAVGWHPPPL